MKTIKKASLLFASLALVLGAGLVGNGDTKEVKAATKELIVDGSVLGSTATTKDTEFTIDGVTYVFSKGAKEQSSAGTNKFTGSSILIGKTGAYIYNKTPLGKKINSFKIYSNKGASTAVSVGLAFSTSPITSSSSSYDYENTLSTDDSIYDVTSSLPENAQYFRYQVTNNKNSQIQFKIGIEEAASKTIKSLTQSGTLKKTAYKVGEAFDPNGLTVTANYDDDTSEDVTSKVTWSEIKSGTTSVIGTYGGLTITIDGIHTLENVLSITPSSLSLKVKEGAQLSYTFKDSKENDVTAELLEWESSNDEVVTVDKNTGYCLAAGKGTAKITLTVIDAKEDTYTASIDVTVTVDPVISEISIADLMKKTKADNTVVSVKGKVANIVNEDYGNFDLVDLEDSSKKIYVYGATKDTTKLTLKDSKNGYYTGSWQSGKNFNSACAEGDIITMNVVVTIFKNTPQIQGVITRVETPSQSIKLSSDSLVIKNGETSQLTATLTGLTGNVSWSSDNTDVADVAEDGTITAKAMGNAKITATLSGVTADCDIAVVEHSGEDAANALTVQEAIYVAKTTSTATAKKYFIKGIIAAYTPNSSDVSGFGNISFDISDDGTENNTFKAFQVKYLGGAKFTSTDQVSIGDEVVLYGAVLTYNNNIQETDGKGNAYVYSHTPADTLKKFVDDWNATIRENENGLCGFLKEENSEPLKALIERYKALEDDNKAELTDSAGVKISESIAYAQNVWEKIQSTDGDYGYGNGNSGVVITSNNSYDKTSLIALFAILGIVTISGYYIIEKKKFSK